MSEMMNRKWRSLLFALSLYTLMTGCADNDNTTTGPSEIVVSEEYRFAWQFLDVYFIYREQLPRDPYAYLTPQQLYMSVNEPYTRYYPPDSLGSINSSLTTQAAGIGVLLDSVSDGYVITDVIQGSPALQSGLWAGDTVLVVNGHSLAGVAYSDVPAFFEGVPGDEKTLRIRRGEQVLTVVVALEPFYAPSVFVDSVDATTAYIRIASFLSQTIADGGTAQEFDQALENTAWANITILDLRNNPGGEVDQCIHVTSEFLDPSTPLVRVTQRVLISQQRAEGATQDTTWETIDVGSDARDRSFYILQNNVTASASEILIVSLNQYRADIRTVGTRTYGKARGQVLGVTPDSGVVRVTYATISPVAGPEYDLVGVAPEVAVRNSESALDVALRLSRGGTARSALALRRFVGRVRLLHELFTVEHEPGMLLRQHP